MNHVVKAKMLRESDEPIHYNCAQSLFVAFSDVLGVSDERAFAMGANYGGGMMHGGTCGVVSAGLMILSLAGIPQEKAMALLQDFSRDHGRDHGLHGTAYESRSGRRDKEGQL